MNKLFVSTGDKTFVEELDWQSFPTESDSTGLGSWAGASQSDISLLEANGGIFTVFDYHAIHLKQRRQLSGSCFLQAPIVLQAYLINKHTKTPCDMMDMSKYVRHYLPTKCLEKYLLKGSGDSLKFLLRILHGEDGRFGHSDYMIMGAVRDSEDMPKKLLGMLIEYGPALITNFLIEEDLRRGSQLIFDGEPKFGTSDDSPRHAMLLVGIRVVPGARQWRLLLQNWWREKQFIEVSLGYMARCDAKVAFILTPQERMMSHVDHNETNFAESTVDDGYDEEDWDRDCDW
jgi:hypothetical protein